MAFRDIMYSRYLGEGEQIQFVIHRHIFMQIKDFAKIIFFGGFIPVVAWWLFPHVAIFAAVWFAIGIVRFLYEFLDWYYDVWLITDVSIVEIVWKGFFEKSAARIEYHTIQGIGYEVKGFLRTIFNYGTIGLDKFAGQSSVFDGAVSPRKKSEMLTEAQEKFITNKSFRDHQTLQGILTDMLQHHAVQHGITQEAEQKIHHE